MTLQNCLTAIPSDRKPTTSEGYVPPTEQQNVGLTTYIITRKQPTDPDNDSSWVDEGFFYLGQKIVNGISFFAAQYSPIVEGLPGPKVDISNCIHTTTTSLSADNGALTILKLADPLTTWTWKMVFTNYGDPSATFTGAMTRSDDTTWDIQGRELASGKPQAFTVTQVPEMNIVAAFNDGTTPQDLELMSSISPIAIPNVCKANEDAAQAYGNKIMNSLMMQSLRGTKIEAVIGSIPRIVDEAQLQILRDNPIFFQRAGAHMISEHFKQDKDSKVPDDIKEHILWKFNTFMMMCSTPAPPPSATPPPAEGVSNPPTAAPAQTSRWNAPQMYGLDLENKTEDLELLATLQHQFQDVTMRCYELGYKTQCPSWANYERHAEEWFTFLAAHYTCPEALGKLTTLAANGSSLDGEVKAESLVRQISNKLTLLKTAATRNVQLANQQYGTKVPPPALDIQAIVNTIDAALHEHMAYLMYIDDHMVSEMANLSSSENLETNLPTAFQAEMAKLGKDVTENSHEMKASISSIFYLVSNHKTALFKKLAGGISKYWNDGAANSRFTIGQVVKEIEMVDLSDVIRAAPAGAANPQPLLNAAEGVEAEVEAVEQINSGGRNFIQKFFGWMKNTEAGAGLKALFQVGVHAAGLYAFFKSVAGGQHMDAVQIGQVVCNLITTGLSVFKVAFAGFSLLRAATWGGVEGNLYKSARAWFAPTLNPAFEEPLSLTKVKNAFVGNFGKATRVIGLVGCIFNLISSYDLMTSSGPDDPVTDRQRTFAKINFSLGVVEGVAMTGEIIGEITGVESISAVCGPLGAIVGIAGLIVMLVELFADPPDPWQPLKDYLAGDPTTFKSYDMSKIVNGDYMITNDLLSMKGFDIPIPAADQSPPPSRPNEGGNDNDNDRNPDVPKFRLITKAQSAAAQALINAIETFVQTVAQYQTGALVCNPAQSLEVAAAVVVTGNYWEPAATKLNTTLSQYISSQNGMISKQAWVVKYPNDNKNDQQGNPFTALCQAMQDGWNFLQVAMSIDA